MGITKFQVLFDNSSKTFTSGQSVTGRLLLSVNSPKRMRGISICFKGEAATKWEVTKETKNNEGNTVYETIQNTGHEIYFENKFNLIGGPSGDTTIQMGDHYYPFNTILPPNIPESYNGKFGHVCYSVKAIMDCPGEASSETSEKFTVICPLDLNEQATLKEPVHKTKEQFFCCCCCRSGPLTMVASLPASGYVPGQEIPVTVEVDNISQEEVTKVMVTLRQIVKFVATFPNKNEKSDETDVQAINFGSVGKNGSETWTKIITVPSLPASNLKLCSIIDIKYELKIEAVLAGMCTGNVTIRVPVTIGTIPLGEVANRPGNYNAMNVAPVHGTTIGFQVPTNGTWEMQPQPFIPTLPPPPSYPNQGMQQPNVGMQPPAIVHQPQMSSPYNPHFGGYVQPNIGMPSPQHVPYPGVASNLPVGVNDQQNPSFGGYNYQGTGTFQNASAPTQ